MKAMLCLTNKKYAVFFPKGGEEQAFAARKADPRLKYARLYEGLQAYPGQVEFGVVYDRYTGKEVEC